MRNGARAAAALADINVLVGEGIHQNGNRVGADLAERLHGAGANRGRIVLQRLGERRQRRLADLRERLGRLTGCLGVSPQQDELEIGDGVLGVGADLAEGAGLRRGGPAHRP